MDVKICPKCKNEKLEVIKEGKMPGKTYMPYGASNWYKCIKCGFESSMFPEVNVKALKSKVKKKK